VFACLVWVWVWVASWPRLHMPAHANTMPNTRHDTYAHSVLDTARTSLTRRACVITRLNLLLVPNVLLLAVACHVPLLPGLLAIATRVAVARVAKRHRVFHLPLFL
jgi:hypothetical protein